MFSRIQSGLIAASALVLSAVTSPAAVDFSRDVKPIFTAKCTECHGGVKAAGGVSFVYQDRIIGYESDSGRPVVKPGDPEGSELYLRIITKDADDRMPPPDEDHDPLSAKEIATIREWIESGGQWSGHWAFEKPVRPEPPKTRWEDRAQNDIDRFVFARLEREGLKPNPPAEPGRLLRRFSLALTGLPPTLEELDAFEAEYSKDRDAAIERALDGLFARPAFGERWASMWLDQARYADSRGLGLDGKRTIWPYRDWVARAFNDDLPFDEFTIMQLAGDLLPEPTIDSLIATALHRNTQTCDEGGTDDEEFRVGAQMDRVSATWQIWGATTFGCVQCHDHPYDPFRNAEYYSFMAFFNNAADSDLSSDAPLLKAPLDRSKFAEAEKLDRRILELQERHWKPADKLRRDVEWQPVDGVKASSNNGTKYSVAKAEGRDEFHTVGTVQTKTAVTIDAPGLASGEPIQALRLTVLPLDPKASVANPEWGFVITKLQAWVRDKEGKKTPLSFARAVPDVAWMPTDPFKVIGADGVGWGADSRIHYRREIALIPKEPVTIPEGGGLLITINCDKTGHGHPMVIKRGRLDYSTDALWTELKPGAADAKSLEDELADTRKRRNAIKSVALPIMLDRQERIARSTRVFVRGNFLDKGDKVTAALPASMRPAEAAEKPTRLDMARWWASNDNPLTARVFVNRLWEQLFGAGIVRTLEDFGSAGEAPTHPELLDHLAVRFQHDLDWSMKALLREMVFSATFQQSSRVAPELLERDPENRLFARGPRGRLPAETVRDQALALSGLLSPKVGGPPVHPPIPEGVWQPFSSGDKWNTPKRGDEDRYRRSLYTYTKRSIPYPSFASFDAPSREFCTPRRMASNTPLQALVTLNDEAFVECAEALAKRIENEFSGSIRSRLSQACRLVTSRDPDDARLNVLETLHNQVVEKAAAGGSESPWLVVAQALLNMDEVLNY